MQTLKLIVREVRQESPLIRSFRLAREDAGPLPAFGPGAHLKVTVPGVHEPRCYSLVQLTPDAGQFAQPTEYRLGVRLEETSQGGSRHMHALAEGDTLSVEGPKNDFPLHESPAGDEPVVLIAGGIGITPVASMAAALKAAGRDFHLHYCGRSKDQLAFLPELEALAGSSLTVHADDDPACRFDLQALLAASTRASTCTCAAPRA